jgi:hypothetical protein
VTIGGTLIVFPMGIGTEEAFGSPSILDFATQKGAYRPLAGLRIGSRGAVILGTHGEIVHASSGELPEGGSASIESP